MEVSDRRLRVGVVGAGMIAQVEHIPNLMFLRDRFELVAVADPSAQVRIGDRRSLWHHYARRPRRA